MLLIYVGFWARLQITGFHSVNALVVIHLVHLFADFLHQCHHLFFLAEQEGEEKEEKRAPSILKDEAGGMAVTARC